MFLRSIKRMIYNMEDIRSLEERVSKIEFVFGQGAEDTTRKIQEEILQDLYKLRETLKEDLKDKSTANTSDNKELLDEIKKLKEENTKLHYRIHHLKQHIQ